MLNYSDVDTAAAFIESQAGQTFRIRIQDTKPRSGHHKAYWVRVYADGKRLKTRGMRRESVLRIKTGKDKQGISRCLMYGELEFHNGEVEAEAVLNHVGLIEVVIFTVGMRTERKPKDETAGEKKTPSRSSARLTPTVPATGTAPNENEESQDDAFRLSEKSKKQGYHIVRLGPVFTPKTAVTSPAISKTTGITTTGDKVLDTRPQIKTHVKYDYKNLPRMHYAKFQFRHRPRERLLADEIIPPTDPAVAGVQMTKAAKSKAPKRPLSTLEAPPVPMSPNATMVKAPVQTHTGTSGASGSDAIGSTSGVKRSRADLEHVDNRLTDMKQATKPEPATSSNQRMKSEAEDIKLTTMLETDVPIIPDEESAANLRLLKAREDVQRAALALSQTHLAVVEEEQRVLKRRKLGRSADEPICIDLD